MDPQQYYALDKIPTALFRQIYGLRRCFPTDLIYAPEDMGGCGNSRLSDIAKLQKWQYPHSFSHLNAAATEVANSLIHRAIQASVMDPSYYCSSLISWGRRMSLTLHPAPTTPVPEALTKFIGAINTGAPDPSRLMHYY